MSTGKEEWLQRYLDGELSDEEEQQALHFIADDPDLRALLKLDLLLRQDLASDFRIDQAADAVDDSVPRLDTTDAREKFSIPETFFEGVMNAISDADEPRSKADYKSQNSATQPVPQSDENNNRRVSFWDKIWQPQPIMWRPVWSAGIAVMILFLAVLSPLFVADTYDDMAQTDIPAREIVEESNDRVMMRFVFIGNDAETVAVAGDFSDWEPITLTRQMINGDVAWTGIVPLPRGEHRYMFIKDGDQWATDPFANRYVDDGFGNKNAIVSL